LLKAAKPFPVSPRNSAPGVASLLQRTNCHRVFASNSTIPEGLTTDVQRELSSQGFFVDIQEIPSISTIYPYLGKEDETVQFGAYYPTRKQRALDEVAIYLHSSGSTGFPKPIPHTFRTVKTFIDIGKKMLFFTGVFVLI
jgi:acyl-coenzyme A synthetase/AMP-(fatty) acid ligase